MAAASASRSHSAINASCATTATTSATSSRACGTARVRSQRKRRTRPRQGARVERKLFERRVAEALATIPREFRDAMQNIAIVVEDEPAPEHLEETEIEPPHTTLALDQGSPLPQRATNYRNPDPDRVLIFQGPHEGETGEEGHLVVCIGETLIHEIGHYFGLSEE